MVEDAVMTGVEQGAALLLAGVIMFFGTVAAVLPLVPGPALVWFSAVIYAIFTNFKEVGPIPLIILTVLMILGSTTNLWMSLLGVKATGGSGWGVVGGMIGMLIGMIVFFPLGALIGAVVGALGIELARTGDLRKALKIGGGTAGGYVLGVVAELLIALIMDVVFIITLVLAHRA
jgi:uncharacterized protein YqgC (DUF456 family)